MEQHNPIATKDEPLSRSRTGHRIGTIAILSVMAWALSGCYTQILRPSTPVLSHRIPAEGDTLAGDSAHASPPVVVQQYNFYDYHGRHRYYDFGYPYLAATLWHVGFRTYYGSYWDTDPYFWYRGERWRHHRMPVVRTPTTSSDPPHTLDPLTRSLMRGEVKIPRPQKGRRSADQRVERESVSSWRATPKQSAVSSPPSVSAPPALSPPDAESGKKEKKKRGRRKGRR